MTVGPEKLNVSFRSVAGLIGGSTIRVGRGGGARSITSTSAANVTFPFGENVVQSAVDLRGRERGLQVGVERQLFPPTCSISLRSRLSGIGRFEPCSHTAAPA